MYTKTAKSVLDPLAEAVSSLVFILSDHERAPNTPIPDLSQVGLDVRVQVIKLAQIGRNISAKWTKDLILQDEILVFLRDSMNGACDVVTQAAEDLVYGTSLLQSSCNQYDKGRNTLLSALRGILEGTTGILDAFDQVEVQKMIASCAQVLHPVREIQSLGSNSSKDWIPAITTLSQNITFLCTLVTKRSRELLSDTLSVRLALCAGNLSQESHLFVATCKLKVGLDSAEPDPQRFLDASCARITTACQDIERVLSNPLAFVGLEQDWKCFRHRQQLLEREYPRDCEVIMGEMNTPASIPRLQELGRRYIQTSNDVIRWTEGILSYFTDSSVNMRLSTLLDITSSCSQLIFARFCLDTPEPSSFSVQQLDHVLAILHENAQNFRVLGVLLANHINAETDLLFRLLAISPTFPPTQPHSYPDKMMYALAIQDANELTRTCHDFESQTDRLFRLIRARLELMNDPHLVWKLRLDISRLEDIFTMIRSSSHWIIKRQSQSPLITEFFAEGMRAWASKLQDIKGPLSGFNSLYSSQDVLYGMILSRSSSPVYSEQRMADHSDLPAFLQTVQRTSRKIAMIVLKDKNDTPFASSNTTVSDYPSDIDKAMQLAQPLIERLLSKTSTMSATSIDEEELESLNGLTKSIKDAFTSIGGVSLPDHEDVSLTAGSRPSVYSSTSDTVYESITELHLQNLNEKTGPEKLPNGFSSKDEIMFSGNSSIQAAGRDLGVEASHWSSINNPIIDSMTRMSDLLCQLAGFHSALNADEVTLQMKSNFISAAQDIMKEASKLANSAQEFMANFQADDRLQHQLLTSIHKISSVSQQLKIIAAVKASSPLDKDKDTQLIVCARNLVKGCKMCLRDCVVMSLRRRSGRREADGDASDGGGFNYGTSSQMSMVPGEGDDSISPSN